MRILLFTVSFLLLAAAYGQNTETDSLKKLLRTTKEDSRRVAILESLSYAYLSSNPDTALQYATEGLELARRINDRQGESICINALGNVYFHVGDNSRALEMYHQYLKMKESLRGTKGFAVAYFNIASAYTEAGDYRLALDYTFEAKK